MMQTIWLARHANRQDFADPEWTASADRPHDPGLSPDGRKQAQHLARRLQEIEINHILSSPFLRTVETAHYVAEWTDQPVFLEPGLGEWLNEDWFETPPEVRTPATLADQFARVSRRHTACRRPSFPETKHEALARLGATGKCLVDRYNDEPLLLVGHGITVQGVLHGLIGQTVPDRGCPLASLTKIVREDGEWSIRLRNDTSHLENGVRASDRLV